MMITLHTFGRVLRFVLELGVLRPKLSLRAKNKGF